MKNIKHFASFYKPHLPLFLLDTFCAILLAACNLFYPYIAKDIINVYVPDKDISSIVIWSIILLGIYIFKLILNYIISYWGHVLGVRIQADMRETMFRKLEKLPHTYYDNNKTGTVMSRIINDLFEIAELAHHAPEDLLISVVTFIGAFIMVGTVNIYLALIVFVVLPFIFIFLINRKSAQREAFKQTRVKTGEINSQVESSIAGIRVSKAYTAEDHELEKFNKSNVQYQIARCEAFRQMAIFNSGMTFFTDILYLIAILAGGLFFANSWIDGGEFTMYILYITALITPIRTFVAIFEQIQSGMTGFERFVEIMNEEEEKDEENAAILGGVKESIVFKDATFHYSRDDEEIKHVIKDLNLTIPKGKTIALVGPSGGGKTTLCHLLPRFYELDSGSIEIDGINIKNFTRKSLRCHIGIVAQDVFLFAGSIRENIAYGKFDATDEEIIEVAKKAKIHEFIMTLENGYDTYIGERGIKLSGGQKQRISIARAFLKNPEILILDEATSALDNVTELQIQEALDDLKDGRTTIVVAHRLSTIRNADEICVITTDGVIEKGNHEQLMSLDGEYKKLYTGFSKLNN